MSKNAISFPGMKLSEYINCQLDVGDIDVVVYSFGINDLNSGATPEEVFINYNKLIRGKKETYLILPPKQAQYVYDKYMDSILLDDDFILITTWCQNYGSVDGLHPDEETVKILEDELKQLISH